MAFDFKTKHSDFGKTKVNKIKITLAIVLRKGSVFQKFIIVVAFHLASTDCIMKCTVLQCVFKIFSRSHSTYVHGLENNRDLRAGKL